MKRWWIVVGLLAAVTLLGLVFFSGLLSADEVAVKGVDTATARQVRTAAQVPVGRPLARVDTGAIATRVESAVPEVTVVDVNRSWPHTITINARPRTVAANVTTGGQVRWVDPSGVLFGPTDRPRKGVPSIVLTKGYTAAEQGDREQAVRDSLTVVASLPKQVRSRLVRVEHRSTDDITLILNPRGVRVTWGNAADSARKAAVLAALLSRKAAVYDVSAPDLPTTKGTEPKGSSNG